METLAVGSRQLPSTFASPSAVSINFHNRACSSLALLRATPLVRTLRCSALLSPSLADQSEKFVEASKKGNLIPLYRSIFSDHLTPVLAYRCLVKEDDRDAPSFLFESVEPGSKDSNVGRYSVIGAQPSIEIVAKENMVTIMDHREGCRTEEIVEDPMTVPRRIMEGWTPQLLDELPEAFCGGWVGFFSYDTVRYVEKKKLPFPSAPPDDRNLPDVHLGLYDDVIVFDHVEKKAHVIHWVQLDQYSSVEEAFNDGIKRLETLVSRVHDIVTPRLPAGSIEFNTQHFGTKLEDSSLTSEEYKEAVLKAKEHILAGDIFQIVLSQRFERRTFADPFEIYRALRIVNPSPYMTYLQARGCILVASSPEILTRVKKQTITNRPLAGTVRRRKTPKEDLLLEKQLLNDEKQFAEHIMLVDLGRNDFGKVTGELLDDLTSWDVLHTALRVGTVSGAPKVKAMELIDKLEVIRRGPYSGGFGGISFSGNMDIALALRTIVFPTSFWYDTMYSYKDANKRREWVAHLQAGAGIVADSDPADEQRKCENKAAAVARAIDLAESSFVDPVMPGYFVYKSGNFGSWVLCEYIQGMAEVGENSVGENSGAKPCEEFWAKLVPSDSRYPDVEISSCEIVVCSEILFSSIGKCKWCKITRNSDHSSATIQNKSSDAIVVDGTVIQTEDTVVIRCGSEITSGLDKEGYLSYRFNVLPGPESCQKKLKISMDDVVTVAPCFHNFCNGCFSEWLKRSQEKRSSVLCP